MINEITEFNALTLEQVINFLRDSKDNINHVISELGRQTYKNEFGTVVIEPANKIFIKIVLSIENDVLKQVTFIGKLSISFSDLVNKYGDYREVYSPYDNLYLYFFNEKSIDKNVIIYKSENLIKNIPVNKLNQIDIKLV